MAIKKKKTEQQEYAEELINWHDVCKKSYDAKHVWREGKVYNPLNLFGLRIPSLFFGKPILIVDVCHACGNLKRRN